MTQGRSRSHSDGDGPVDRSTGAGAPSSEETLRDDSPRTNAGAGPSPGADRVAQRIDDGAHDEVELWFG